MPITVTRRKSRFWYGRGTHLGVSIDRSTGIVIDPRAEARSRETARAVCRKWEREIEGAVIHGVTPVPVFADLASDYMERGKSPAHLIPLIDFMGETPGDQIDQRLCDRAAVAILRPGSEDSTVNRQIYTPVRAVLNAAGLDPKIKARPEKRKAKVWLTPEQVEGVLFPQIDEGYSRSGSSALHVARTAAIVGMLVGTGMRPGELAAMYETELYLPTNEARIVPHDGGDKTALAARMLHLPQRSVDALKNYRTERGRIGGPVIDNGRGEPIPVGSAFRKTVPSAYRRAGLDIEGLTIYSLRHTWATWYYAATRDLRGLMERGGWSSAEMAMYYTKVAPADLGDRIRAHGWDMEAGEYAGTVKYPASISL